MCDLSNVNSPVDIITVVEKLRGKGWLEEVGSEAYLSELTGCAATSGNVQYYAEIVREKSTLRRLISAAAEITTDCFSPDREAQTVLDAAESKIFSISESRIKDGFESVGQLLPRTFEEIANFREGHINGVPTGFKELDQVTTGLQKGDLVIVGGRPSMGKTAFCLSIALHAAKANFPTAIFSLEMSKSQLTYRMLCAEARVDMHLLRSGRLPPADHRKLSQHAGPLYEAPLLIDDTPAISVLELKAKARHLKKQKNLALIVVDYLQLMSPSVKMESMQQDVALISRSLKSVAKELDLPVVALSQLSRATVQRGEKDHRPRLSDLRDSGAIEQDADVVMFVHRDEYYIKDDPNNKGKAEIIVAKQRNGPTDTVNVAFVKQFAKFEDLSLRTDDPGRES
jgi:replicative DNA helicase